MRVVRSSRSRGIVAVAVLPVVLCAAVLAVDSCANSGTTNGGSGSVDLRAGAVAFAPADPAGTSGAEGGSLAVSFTIVNTQATAVASTGYSVSFYMSASSTFAPSSDLVLSPATPPALPSVAANGSATVSATLSMPSGSAATPYVNQCDYIYGVVTATGDINTANDTTTAADAMVVLFSPSSLPTTYSNVTVEVYSPDGGSYASNPLFAIYNSVGTTNEGNDKLSTGYGSVTGLSLPSGTYYIAVLNNGNGPYALDVRTGNVAHQTFATALTSDPDNTNDNNPSVSYTEIGTTPSALNTSGAKVLTVGNAVNWWGPSGETDWFRFTLP